MSPPAERVGVRNLVAAGELKPDEGDARLHAPKIDKHAGDAKR